MKPLKVKEIEDLRQRISKLRKRVDILSKSKEVKDYWHKYYSKKALCFVRQELDDGNMVWCRNASICSKATPCIDLECKYKSNNKDISRGCSKCHSFQITTLSNTWDGARHITPKWMMNLSVGW